MTTLTEFIAQKAQKTEQALHAYLATWRDAPPGLTDAIEYSLFAGGKRLRPALTLGAADIIAGDDAPALPAAAAIEMIHTYSLIHDDLPAMDDDDLRRGKPTSHKVHGEATAILAGDTLLAMAFELLVTTHNVAVIAEIARAAGATGMAGGQYLDLKAEGQSLSLEQLKAIHNAKTGALIRASLRAGAMLAGAGEEQLAALTKYGQHLGLAFQVTDDILDITGNEASLGKPIGSDESKHKSTYPSLMGIERARELAGEESSSAVDALGVFGTEADPLRQLAGYIVDRDK